MMSFLIWLVSCVFIVHDFEEIIVMERWILVNENDLLNVIPRKFHGYFRSVFPRHTAGFAVAVLLEYIGILIISVLATFAERDKWSYLGILSIVSILFLHSFTHIAQSVVLKRYTPGVLTAVVLLIPFCLYFYVFVLSHQFASWGVIWLSVPVGIVVAVMLNQSGLRLGKRLESSFPVER